ncbi:MAG: helix-turn-helix domain-containing protein [Alphaproteobacteria bacterium]|nr:helix-turn-helix domain-containing protein [Alphaproteobacteria bacterium]MBQ7185668.1 helix-turn-helix domain-containing protein [Alphaproteobacteria bacterium]
MILIDAKYFGNALRNARRSQGLNTKSAAKMLGLNPRQLHRLEHGNETIPDGVLCSLFCRGFCMMRCQKTTGKK